MYVVGGGILRTGCGPGPLEPALGNSSEGNTAADKNGRTRRGDAAVLFMKIVVNGKDLEVAAGLSVDGLLAHLGVKRQYTAVAVNREVTPKSAYEATVLHDGDRVEIVRPMGGG
jgi:sulfur carrier protein